jgi:hypothetical protein
MRGWLLTDFSGWQTGVHMRHNSLLFDGLILYYFMGSREPNDHQFKPAFDTGWPKKLRPFIFSPEPQPYNAPVFIQGKNRRAREAARAKLPGGGEPEGLKDRPPGLEGL